MSEQEQDVAAIDIPEKLEDFARKTELYRQACEQYQRGEADMGDITRHLSEASADAESFFAEQSHRMDLEQLQRYAMLQNQLDSLTVQVFETEIAHNQKVIEEALRHGDYFIVNLTYNAIRSSIYMIYSKQKIKTQQEQRLAQAQQELEIAQTFIKVLKAVESVLRPESGQFEWPKIQKAIAIYTDYFQHAEPNVIKLASDQRIFALFAEHAAELASQQPAGWLPHLARCKGLLDKLATRPEHSASLASWESLLSAPQADEPAVPVPAAPESAMVEAPLLSRYLDQLASLLEIQAVSELDFAELESRLNQFAAMLSAQDGADTHVAARQRLFSLFEHYVDFLSNVDFAGQPSAAADHIARCCQTLQGFVRTRSERQMLEAWQTIRNSLGVLLPTPAPEPVSAEAERLQQLLDSFHAFEALVATPGASQLNYAEIQAALARYAGHAASTADLPIRSSLDERLFELLAQHVAYLYGEPFVAQPEQVNAHIAACCQRLESLNLEPLLRECLEAWQILSQTQ